jgi:Tol biopolymer transport system component
VNGLGIAPSLFGANLSNDGLTLYFSQTLNAPNTDEDIYIARRPTRAADFTPASKVVEVNTAVSDSSPFITQDGLSLYFSSSRTGGRGLFDIWMATRPNLNSAFLPPVNLAELNTRDDDHLPSLTGDGLEIFLTSGRKTERIWRATRSDTASPFSIPVMDQQLEQVNAGIASSCASISLDGLTIVFTSSRDGFMDDIFLSTRNRRGDIFPPPVNLAVINSIAEEEDASISADGTEIIFSSNRNGDGSRLWHAFRGCQ